MALLAQAAFNVRLWRMASSSAAINHFHSTIAHCYVTKRSRFLFPAAPARVVYANPESDLMLRNEHIYEHSFE